MMQNNDYFPALDELEDTSSDLLYNPGFDFAIDQQDQDDVHDYGHDDLPLSHPFNNAPVHHNPNVHNNQLVFNIPIQPQGVQSMYPQPRKGPGIATPVGAPTRVTAPARLPPSAIDSLPDTAPVQSAKPRRKKEKEPVIEDVSAEDMQERKRAERRMRNREYAQVSREKKKKLANSMEHQNKELCETVTDLEEQLTAARLEISSLRLEITSITRANTCAKCAGPMNGVNGPRGGTSTAANVHPFSAAAAAAAAAASFNPHSEFLSIAHGDASPPTDNSTDGSTSPIGSTSPSSPLGTEPLTGFLDQLSSFTNFRLPAQARPAGMFLFALVVTFGAFYTLSGLPITQPKGHTLEALEPPPFILPQSAPAPEHIFSSGARVLSDTESAKQKYLSTEMAVEGSEQNYLPTESTVSSVHERLQQLEGERALAVEKLWKARLQLREERRDHNKLKSQLNAKSSAIHLPPPGGFDQETLAMEVAGVEHRSSLRLRGSAGHRRSSVSEQFDDDQYDTPLKDEDGDPFAMFAKILLNSSFALDLHTSYVLCPNAIFLAAPSLGSDISPAGRALRSSEMEVEIKSTPVVKVSHTDPTSRFRTSRIRTTKLEDESSSESPPQGHYQDQGPPTPKRGDRLVIWLPSSSLNTSSPPNSASQVGISKIECSVTSIDSIWSSVDS